MVEPGWSLEVDPESHGDRLDRFIARRLARVSRNRAARLEVVDLAIPDAIATYKQEVRDGVFPAEAHTFHAKTALFGPHEVPPGEAPDEDDAIGLYGVPVELS